MLICTKADFGIQIGKNLDSKLWDSELGLAVDLVFMRCAGGGFIGGSGKCS
jgi:hypothetical protein